jgi:AcrR family transcriptional regulator
MNPHGAPNGHSHEKTDAATRPILRLVAGLAVFVAAAMVVMAILFSYFTDREAVLDTSVSPLAQEAVQPLAEPALQPNPAVDLERLRRTEDALLTSYGWVDQREGLVRIPIERAIELVAERGLPARPEATGGQ